MPTPLQHGASLVHKYGSGLTEIGGAYKETDVRPTNQIAEEGRFASSDKTAGLTTKSKAAKRLRKNMHDVGSVITRPRQY
jgi:hypothetical protein